MYKKYSDTAPKGNNTTIQKDNDTTQKYNENDDKEEYNKRLLLEAEKIAIEGIIGIYMTTASALKDKKL